MKKLLLAVIVSMFCFAGIARADIFNPIGPGNEKLTATNPGTLFDNGSILSDLTQIINYLGVRDGFAYNITRHKWDSTVGATVVTYAPWNLAGGLNMLNTDGVTGTADWNLGKYLPVENVPIMKYLQYFYISAGGGWEQNTKGAWKGVATIGPELKFTF